MTYRHVELDQDGYDLGTDIVELLIEHDLHPAQTTMVLGGLLAQCLLNAFDNDEAQTLAQFEIVAEAIRLRIKGQQDMRTVGSS